MAAPYPVQWLDTPQMAQRFGIHPKTLLRLRAASFSPFREGEHYRRRGLTTRAPLHWHPTLSEEAFTAFKRIDPSSVEAFNREVI